MDSAIKHLYTLKDKVKNDFEKETIDKIISLLKDLEDREVITEDSKSLKELLGSLREANVGDHVLMERIYKDLRQHIVKLVKKRKNHFQDLGVMWGAVAGFLVLMAEPHFPEKYMCIDGLTCVSDFSYLLIAFTILLGLVIGTCWDKLNLEITKTQNESGI